MPTTHERLTGGAVAAAEATDAVVRSIFADASLPSDEAKIATLAAYSAARQGDAAALGSSRWDDYRGRADRMFILYGSDAAAQR